MSIAQTERKVMRAPLDDWDMQNLATLAADPFARLSSYAGDRLWFSGLVYWDKEKGNRAVFTRKGWRTFRASVRSSQAPSKLKD